MSLSAQERPDPAHGPPSRPLAKCAKKVILLGHFGVGKSSLIQRFVHAAFSAEYQTTIGVKIDKKVVTTDSHEIKMLLWDIEGSPDQTALPRSYFLGAHGIIYVCDLTRPSTFNELAGSLEALREKSPDASVVVIGNKSDLLQEEQLAELQSSDQWRFDFLSSAESGQNVEEAFRTLAMRMLAPCS